MTRRKSAEDISGSTFADLYDVQEEDEDGALFEDLRSLEGVQQKLQDLMMR